MTYKRALLIAFTTIILGLVTTAWVLSTRATPLVRRQLEKIGVVLLDNKPLELKGKISWQILPRPAVKICQVETEPQQAQNASFLHIDSMHFKFNLRAFLHGRFVVEQVMLDGVRGRFAAGSLFKRQANSQEEGAAPFILPKSFSIHNLVLHDANIFLVEGQHQVELRNLQATLENPLELHDKAIPIQLKSNLRVLHNKKNVLNSQIGFKGSIQITAPTGASPKNWPERLSLQGLLDTRQSLVQNIQIDSLQSPLRFEKVMLHLGPYSAKLYRGESIGELHYALQTGQLKISQTAQDLNSSELAKALLGEKILQGKLDSSLQMDIPTKKPNWLAQARLSGNINLKHAILHAFSLDKLVSTMERNMDNISKTKQNAKPPTGLSFTSFSEAKLDGQTQIDLLNISFTQENARLDLSNMMLETKSVDVMGKGQYHFSDNQLRGNVFAHLNAPSGRLALLQKAMGGNIPLLLEGSLANPSVRPDLQKINPVVTALWIKRAFEMPFIPIYELQKTVIQFIPGLSKPSKPSQ